MLTADCEAEARAWLEEVYEKEHRALDEVAGQKDWEYSTNINEETAAASVSMEASAAFEASVAFEAYVAFSASVVF